MTPKLKICGMKYADNLQEMAALKPDFLGFIFYPPSPRDVSRIIDTLTLHNLSESIKKVAVFVNMDIADATDIISRYNFDAVQLHGNETPDYCNALSKMVPVIKAFSVYDKMPDNINDYEESCDYFLFDTKTELPGGSGLAFDHQVLAGYKSSKPWFLSGGISSETDLTFAGKKIPIPFAIDINSRFEISPGIKNADQVKDFIHRINQQKWE
jgi:phosphoribosylanthranilate isomerase